MSSTKSRVKGFLRLKLSYEDSQQENVQQTVDQSEAAILSRDQQQEVNTSAPDVDNRTEVIFSIFVDFFYYETVIILYFLCLYTLSCLQSLLFLNLGCRFELFYL